MLNVVVTGSQGFIGSYICQELLDNGYNVIGIDNYAKYGFVDRPHDKHPNFTFLCHDLTKSFPRRDIALKGYPSYLIAAAASIGGISYFDKYAFDLVCTNDRINCNTFEYAIDAHELGYLKKIVPISSSMVYENCFEYPSKEEFVASSPSPSSTYGFNKLNLEYYAYGANKQYGLPYTIVRPFNAVGIGEEDVIKGNTHVLPDLVYKALSRNRIDRFPILGDGKQVRHYTHAKDIARGVRLAMESDHLGAFNISSSRSTSVKELAEMVWGRIHDTRPKFKYEKPLEHDVQKRVPCVEKAKELLGFEAKISLEESIDEVIKWVKKKV